MADVYGRLTGKAGVCLATLGPGKQINTGQADANADRRSSCKYYWRINKRLHKESQIMDSISMVAPISKWVRQF